MQIPKNMRYALAGVKTMLAERNFKIHLIADTLLLCVAAILQVSISDYAILSLGICIVLAAETFNSSIEQVCNVIRDNLGASYESTKVARDMASGAVFIMILGLSIVSLEILVPRLMAVL